MASHHHEDPIFQEKRKPKSPIKFKTELNSEQKEILKEYIHSISDAPKLKEFLNTKFKKISESLKKNISKIDDPTLKIKIQEVINLIDPILESKKLRDDHVIALLQYVELSQEVDLI